MATKHRQLPMGWIAAIAEWTIYLAAHFSTGTVASRPKPVVKFAVESLIATPGEVTEADINSWLAASGVSRATQSCYRVSFRSFFSYCLMTGLIDPATHDVIPASRRPQNEAPEGWAEWIDLWSNYMKASKFTPDTIRTRLYPVIRFALECGLASPKKVKPDHLMAWLANDDWSRDCAYNYRSGLRQFFRYLYDFDHIKRDPAKRLPKIKRQKHESRPCPDAVIVEALAEATPAVRWLLLLAACHGLRRSELARVNSANLVDTEEGVGLKVVGKGLREDTIFFNEAETELIEAIRGADGYLFPGNVDGHIGGRTVACMIRAATHGWAPHSLRHRFCNAVYHDSHDLLVTQKASRHASPETTRDYIKIDEHMTRQQTAAALHPFVPTTTGAPS
jgi:integrase